MTTDIKPYRYLVITELFQPTKGGTPVWYDAVYRRLGGKDVHIVTAKVPGDELHDATNPNSVHRISLRRHWWLSPESLGMYARMLAKSLTLALRRRFDIVHAARALPEGPVGLVMAHLLRRPLVVYCHGEELTTWGRGAKFKAMLFVFRHADAIIANSEYTRDEMLRIGVDRERIRLIFPGVELQRFHPGLECDSLRRSLGADGARKLILSVGRLYRRKGFDQVLRALPGLVARGFDVHYAIVGIGADREHLARLARELGVAERVTLLGLVAEEDLPRWYNAADVFAMPNRDIDGDTEGFGMVFIEAAACGKPAVAGRAGGTGAAVVDGVTGLRVDGASLEEVGDGLARLLGDPEQARKMGENGYARVRREFSWDAVAARTASLDRELSQRYHAGKHR